MDPGRHVISSSGNIGEGDGFEAIIQIVTDRYIGIGEVRLTPCCLINDSWQETRAIGSSHDQGLDFGAYLVGSETVTGEEYSNRGETQEAVERRVGSCLLI